MAEFASAVDGDEVESLEVRLPEEVVEVDVEAQRALTAPMADAPAVDTVDERWLTVDVVRFSSDRWVLADPYSGVKMHVGIEDESFRQQVADGEQFAQGDSLRARLRTRQWLGDAGEPIRTEYSVVEVLEHNREGGVTPPLPSPSDEDS